MSKRLQELQYHPLGGNVPETSILLIKNTTTPSGSYEDFKISFQDFTQKLIRQDEATQTPLINQIPRLVSGTGGVPALPAVSGEFLTNMNLTIPVGTDTTHGLLKLSHSTTSSSGVMGGVAATPSAVKEVNDLKPNKGGNENISGNWVFSGDASFIGNLIGTLTGSSESLTTPRKINGTYFNGVSDITTLFWGTSRSFTIGDSSKIVDGSSNINWNIQEIGAAGNLEIRETIRRSYAGLGFILRDNPESFENGGTLTLPEDVLLHQLTGKCYSGLGPFPQTVIAGTNPNSSGFIDRSPSSEGAVYTSSSEVSTGKYPIGKTVILTDRALAVFKITSGGTADGYSVIPAGGGNTATLQHNGSVNLRWLGGIPLSDCRLVLQAAANYSNINKVPIILDAIFYSTSSIICGTSSNQNHVVFQSPVIPTQHFQQIGGIYFSGCDGFRIVQRTTLGLSGLEIRGDGTTTIPSPYGDYLKGLSYSAIRSNEDTNDRNCIAYVNSCKFRQWKTAWDFSRGSWSCHFENNYLDYCYQTGKHYRPHSSRFIHNTSGYCVRGFELIEQASGEFHNNELNTGKYTEFLIKHTKVGTVSCCNNYIEHWETPDEVDPLANYGLGFIPIIVEHDRFQAISDVKMDNNLINVPGAYCAILITPHDSQKTNNNVTQIIKPRGNDIIGTSFAKIVVATTGTGNLTCDGMSGGVQEYDLKTAQLGGATGKVTFCGADAITVWEKEWVSRSDITTAASTQTALFSLVDVVKDTSFEHNNLGVNHTVDSRSKVKIRLFIEAKTDATAATLKLIMSQFNSKTRTYEYSIAPNSSTPIVIEFVQSDGWNSISDFSFRLNFVTTQPTYLRVHAVREFVANY